MASNIQWTDETWNPTTGCTKLSPGCKHCYAEKMHARLTAMGLAKYSRPFGEVVFHPESLTLPLRWYGPRRVFVDSMSDLFHEDVPDAFIDQVFAIMALARDHTFQLVTKRIERAPEYLGDLHPGSARVLAIRQATAPFMALAGNPPWAIRFPLTNVHLITSCENQRYAQERIPWLFKCPAAVRGVSLEPLLGPIDLTHIDAEAAGHADYCVINALTGRHTDMARPCPDVPRLDWVIVGCESGSGRRPCELDWIRDIVRQCRTAGVPCFVKQVSIDGRVSKDPRAWPDELRVRMYPGEKWTS